MTQAYRTIVYRIAAMKATIRIPITAVTNCQIILRFSSSTLKILIKMAVPMSMAAATIENPNKTVLVESEGDGQSIGGMITRKLASDSSIVTSLYSVVPPESKSRNFEPQYTDLLNWKLSPTFN